MVLWKVFKMTSENMPERIWVSVYEDERGLGLLINRNGEKISKIDTQYTLTSSLEPLFKRLLANPAIDDELKEEMREILK